MQQLIELNLEEIKLIDEAVQELLPVLKMNPATQMMPFDSFVTLMEALVKTGLKLKENTEK